MSVFAVKALRIIPNSHVGWSNKGSTSLSLNPDTVVETWRFLANDSPK
jgi:hypothetical protein